MPAQEAFIAAPGKIFLHDLGADEVVYSAGAVRPEYQGRSAYVWVGSGDNVAVRRTIWRKRPL